MQRAQPAVPPAAPVQPPRLIVALSIDQLSTQLYDEYHPLLTRGFARLSQGTVFRNGYQSHNATETCPGHSTIMTGARPSRTGIIANFWFDQSQQRSDKGVYCAEDERVPGSSSSDYMVSPYHLRVPTLGDLLKQIQPGSRNVAVAGKDRSAVMMGGHDVDQRWYWDGKTFSTDLKGIAMPRSVSATKTAVANAIAEARPALLLPPACGATLALAAALVDEMQLGRGTTTDILSVSLAGTDVIGHAFGTEGAEMCLQLYSLDRDLGDFFNLLDRRGLDYMVVLTADHGGPDIPERGRHEGAPAAARVDANLTAARIGAAIGRELGLKGPVLFGEGSFGDMYVDRSLSPADQVRARAAAVAAFRAHPQVEVVFTREQLASTASPTSPPDQWSLIERARASFDPERSGDFVVLLKRGINPVPDTTRYVTTHGSPWDYDRRVPIIFWRKGMAAAQRNDHIETVDIMPTLAASIGLAVDPSSIDGECLAGVGRIGCPQR